MRNQRSLSRLLLALTLPALTVACGPAKPDAGLTMVDAAPLPDGDGDGIADIHEGLAEGTDTDKDGKPDAADDDADGDGIPDRVEAGDTDTLTEPFDSDFDGTPDFRDLDSDDNGRRDEIDGQTDFDSDGVGDFADTDDDNDYIMDSVELSAAPEAPVDGDRDGKPDYHDDDSDGDGVPDVIEMAADYDNDGTPNYLDIDSDGDCRPDNTEYNAQAPDSDGDGNPDLLDRDADDDGLLDKNEDLNCNGQADPSETSATAIDTDNDGASDLVEKTAGTSPTDASKNPQAKGDFVFVVPYQKPQFPDKAGLNFKTRLRDVDVYVLVDRSGSMDAETRSIQTTMDAAIKRMQCPPLGSGDPETCIANLQAGFGGIGYSDVDPYLNFARISPTPAIGQRLLANVSGSATVAEPTFYALWATITGKGSTSLTCPGLARYSAADRCANGGFGYACFRTTALPVIVLATDEPPLNTYTCPGWDVTLSALRARSAKVIGIVGSTEEDGAWATAPQLRTMATQTGAVDSRNGNAPLVFDGSDSGAGAAVERGIRTLVAGVPMDMAATATDDSGDELDTVAAFVDHLETQQLGTPECAASLTDVDSNNDGHKDAYVQVRAGVPVCWQLATKQNTTVPGKATPQLFKAKVNVVGDGVTVLDSRQVYFLVPPSPQDTPIQ